MSAIGHPASSRGGRTVFPGDRIAALSAMKWTPPKTMTSAVVSPPPARPERVARDVGDLLDFVPLVVVRQEDRVALLQQRLDLRLEGRQFLRIASFSFSSFSARAKSSSTASRTSFPSWRMPCTCPLWHRHPRAARQLHGGNRRPDPLGHHRHPRKDVASSLRVPRASPPSGCERSPVQVRTRSPIPAQPGERLRVPPRGGRPAGRSRRAPGR